MHNTSITPSQYRISVGFAWFMIVLGAVLIFFGILMLKDAYASRKWPTVEGKVQGIRVRSERTGRTTSSRKRSYYFEISYTYMVDSQMYTGNRFSLGAGPRASKKFSHEEDARAEAHKQHPFGSTIPVYYEPGNPESAVLESGANWGSYVPLLLGVFFLSGGLFFLGIMRKYVGNSTSLHYS